MVHIIFILILVLTSWAQENRPLSLKIIGFDEKNKPVMSGVLSLDNKLAEKIAQRQEESCVEGMGELRGYCGTYQGLITEEEDQANKCELIKNPISLLLDSNGSVNLYSGTGPNQIVQSNSFFLSRINYNSKRTSIELSSRSCRPINGIKFPNDDCKRQALAGSFSTFNKARHFYGFYTIMDERSGQICRYRFSFDQTD